MLPYTISSTKNLPHRDIRGGLAGLQIGQQPKLETEEVLIKKIQITLQHHNKPITTLTMCPHGRKATNHLNKRNRHALASRLVHAAPTSMTK